MSSIHKVLFKGLETVRSSGEFKKKAKAVEDAAFAKIISEAEHLSWTRTEKGLQGTLEFTAEAIVKNAVDEDVTITVYFHKESEPSSDPWYYLSLGELNGPTRNSNDIRVRELVKYFD